MPIIYYAFPAYSLPGCWTKKSRLMLLLFSAALAEIILLFVDVPSWGAGEVVVCLV